MEDHPRAVSKHLKNYWPGQIYSAIYGSNQAKILCSHVEMGLKHNVSGLELRQLG